jgi:polyphenol oxidase
VLTDRHGGVSRTPYASLNFGDHVGDEPEAVAENRRRLAASVPGVPGVPADPGEWVWLRQVHGAEVVTAAAALHPVPEADAVVTTRPGLPLVVLTADCAPIALVADGAVAVVHAGWPGLEQGVIARAVERLRALAPGPVRAVVGPCVHPAHYEFGADLLERLVSVLGPEVASRTATGTLALDVPTAVRVSLVRAGVDDVDDLDVCTFASPDHFSYRRDGVTGRQAIVAVLDR